MPTLQKEAFVTVYDRANVPFPARWPMAKAMAMVQSGEAEIIWGRKQVESIRLIAKPTGSTPKEPKSTLKSGTKYSHNRKTRDNPENVWTLHRISRKDRCVFLTSIIDCLSS